MINEEGLKKIIQEQITSALDLSKYDLSTDSVLSIYKFVKDKLDEKIIQERILEDRKKRDITSLSGEEQMVDSLIESARENGGITSLSEEEEQMVDSLIESARENSGKITTLYPIPDKIITEVNRRISIDPNLLKKDASISRHH